jgi:hypothetical protein
MLGAGVCARSHGGPVRLGVLAVALVVVILALFALGQVSYAGLPDQTWIAGIYDGDDSSDMLWLLADTIMPRECAASAGVAWPARLPNVDGPPPLLRLALHPGSINRRAPPTTKTAR